MAWPWFLQGNYLSLMVLAIIIASIWIFDRRKFRKESTLFYLRRTSHGLNAIDSFAQKHSLFFKRFGEASIAFSFGLLGLWYMFSQTKKSKVMKAGIVAAYLVFSILAVFLLQADFIRVLSIFTPPSYLMAPFVFTLMALAVTFGVVGFGFSFLFLTTLGVVVGRVITPQVRILLPVEVPEELGLPILGMPILNWLVSIFVILVVHEFSHAFVARAHKIRVKSLGYGFLAFIPVGFAEPDEEQLKRTPLIKRSAIYAAGSFSNVLTSIVVGLIIIALLFVWPLLTAGAISGVEYTSTISSLPSSAILPQKGIITQIDSTPITNLTVLIDVMSRVTPNQTIGIVVNDNGYLIRTSQDSYNSLRALIGIRSASDPCTPLISSSCNTNSFSNIGWLRAGLIVNIFNTIVLLGWLAFLNLAIAIVNLLPIKPFDGGFLLEDILRAINPKRWKFNYKIIATLTLIFIIVNIFGPYVTQAVLSIL